MVTRNHAIVEERPIDGKRPLRVICVGAGISGIITAIRFPQRIPNLELQIYEKNPDITGTWFENRYPGCACGTYLVLTWFESELTWKQIFQLIHTN
jgi:cation diffusion facilitator CzcD-associated flavoprotein CzcO